MTNRQAAEIAEIQAIVGILTMRNVAHAGEKSDLQTAANALKAQLDAAMTPAPETKPDDPLGR